MKNKGLFTFLGLMLVAVLLFSSCPAPTTEPVTPPEEKPVTPAEEPIELTFAWNWPTLHYVTTEQNSVWVAEVEKATNGRVKITTYPGGTLLKTGDNYDGVVTGVCDIASCIPAYTRGRFPLLEGLDLPGIPYKNATVSAKVAWETCKKFKPEELADTKVLFFFTTGPGYIMSKGIPVRNLEELEGLRVRCTGLSAKSIEALGGVPIGISQNEVYEALQKGVCDATLGPAEGLKAFKHAEVVDYITPVEFMYSTAFITVMNREKWDALPRDVQEAIDEVSEGWSERAGKIWDLHVQECLAYAAEEEGVEMVQISPEEKAVWVLLLEPLKAEYIASMESKGLLGREFLDEIFQLTEQYNKEL